MHVCVCGVGRRGEGRVGSDISISHNFWLKTDFTPLTGLEGFLGFLNTALFFLKLPQPE